MESEAFWQCMGAAFYVGSLTACLIRYALDMIEVRYEAKQRQQRREQP